MEEPKELGLGAAVRPSAGESITWSITEPWPPKGSEPKRSRKQKKNTMIWDAEGIQQIGLQIHPMLPCSQPQPHPGWQQRFPQGRATPGRQEGPSSSHGCGLGAGWAGLGSPLRPGSLSA